MRFSRQAIALACVYMCLQVLANDTRQATVFPRYCSCEFPLVSSLNPQRFVRFTGYDIFTSGVPLEVDPILNPNTVCKNTPSLSKEQMELCKSHADVVASALQGAQMAVHECQERFKYRRWNCSALETKNKNPLTSGLLARGTLILVQLTQRLREGFLIKNTSKSFIAQ